MLTTRATAPTDTPRHISFIADGNRRWAELHGTTREQGFRKGAAAVHQVLDHCRNLGVETASVFLMSARNFQRAPAEVAVLNEVIADLVDAEAAAATGPIRVLGSRTVLHEHGSDRLVHAINAAHRSTADLTGMTVCLGIGYDGRHDVQQAVTRALTAPDYDEREELPVDRYLSTAGLPDPDLIVRSSGERRLSGWMLHQSADSTLVFDDQRYWPEYGPDAVDEAIGIHNEQRRTFGY
ncbi:polyprenyl diphosphate synthase [Streptomyces bauhiniae]|uniref:polyprenyl diphosphate synthase n=1 Tax=Streptomyces bauhiniae TaxID=2340725 RepID=UPI0033B9323D